jgi:hypothetical protein
MKHLSVAALLFSLSSNVLADSKANYYRVWQGFKRPELSESKFQATLPSFMNTTIRIYTDHRALNEYLVGVTPRKKPAFVPDEFALVALDSEEHYKEIRATSEGKAYGESHWTLFDARRSKSASLIRYFQENPESLRSNTAYDMTGTPHDWSQGHTTFFLGLKKNGISSEEFLIRLKKHIELVAKELAPLGLHGYVIIANEQYEAAYMNWPDVRTMEVAFQSETGSMVRKDAESFMEFLQWSAPEAFNGRSISAGHFYQTIF